MNLTRISHLFRAYFIENKRRLLICCLAVFAAAVLDLTINRYATSSTILASFVAFVLAARIFQPSLKRNNSTHFFNLPVTTGEKLIVATVFVTVFSAVILLLYSAGAYTGYYGLCPILNPEASMYMERSLPIGLWDTQAYLYFAVVLSVLLFGSIYFKKNAFWKTFAAGIGFFIGVICYQIVLIRIAFGNFRDFSTELTLQLRDLEFVANYHTIPIIIILFFLSLTYLRLKETEV
ncbi:MAG: hypothetical protein FWF65_06690 [Bacteroidetes bacterium]|nr:hypothetical protein [Bacteroidota bacterium]